MKKIKAYVGLGNRFVICERFPDDEAHAGLHDLLQDWIDHGTILREEPMEQGFYLLEFGLERNGYSDDYLVLKRFEKIGE